MNYERPVVKTDPNSTLRNRNMTVKKAEVKPNNTIKARPIETKVAQFKDLNFDNVDPDSFDDVLLWLKTQISKDKNFSYNNYNVISIDEKTKTIELYNKKTREKETRSLGAFIDYLGNGIKNATGQGKLGGKTITDTEVVEMIKKDISIGRTLNGKKIVRIDVENGVVYLESNENFGFEQKVSLNDFIETYKKQRKLGVFGDTVEIEQQLEQNERQRNLEDMTEAFRAALGIKPPKVKYFIPLKIHRGVAQVPNQYRDYNYNWTDEEITQVHRLGKTPNPPTKVDGLLHDTFNPIAPPPKEARDFIAQKEIGFSSRESARQG